MLGGVTAGAPVAGCRCNLIELLPSYRLRVLDGRAGSVLQTHIVKGTLVGLFGEISQSKSAVVAEPVDAQR